MLYTTYMNQHGAHMLVGSRESTRAHALRWHWNQQSTGRHACLPPPSSSSSFLCCLSDATCLASNYINTSRYQHHFYLFYVFFNTSPLSQTSKLFHIVCFRCCRRDFLGMFIQLLIQLSVLIQYKADVIIISLKIYLFSP